MKINKDLNISDDSSVSIQTDGFFGSKFLMIEMGGTNNFMKMVIIFLLQKTHNDSGSAR